MKLSIVVSTQATSFSALAYQENLDQSLARVAELGYDGAELAIRDPSLLEITPLQNLLQRYDLHVPAIGTGQAFGEEGLSFSDPDPDVRWRARERIMAQCDFATHFGATVIIGLIRGKVKPGVSFEQAKRWMMESLEQCAEYALRRDVTLSIEPINRYETSLINCVAEGLEIIETIGAPNLGLLLDTFHMNIEEPRIVESIKAAGKRLFHFHVADSNRWYPGAGHIDFSEVIAALREIGYEGWISGEMLPKPDADTAARMTIQHLRALGA